MNAGVQNGSGAGLARQTQQGWGCMMLFALPFAFIGLTALFFGFKSLSAGSNKDTVDHFLFGGVFTLGGLGMLIGGLFARKAEKAKNERKAAHPNEPWHWRTDWAQGRADSQGRLGVIGIWLFAIFWNAVSLPVCLIVVPPELKKGNYMVLVALLFPLIGLGFLAAATYATIQRRKYGRPFVKLMTNPCAIGGQMAGLVEIPTKVKPADGFKVKLECIKRMVTGSGKNRTTRETPLWTNATTVTQDLLAHEPARTGVPVQFDIPGSVEEASWDDCNPSIHWRLTVEADVPGVDFKETFELPVFRTADSPASSGVFISEAPRWDKPVETYTPPAHSRIQVQGLPSGGSSIVFPAARNPGAIVTLFFVTAIFAAVMAIMFYKKAPIFIPIVLGIFDSFLMLFLFSLLTHASRVEADAGGVRVMDSWLAFRKSRSYQPNEVVDVVAKLGMQAGNKSYYDIQLQLRSGQDITVGSSVPDAEHAAWLAAVVKQAIAPKE